MACVAEAKTWTDYALALAPLVISGVVAGIVFAQWKLGREKLRLDLYDRRFEVWDSIFDFYGALIGWKGTPTDVIARGRFFKAYQASRFLFKEEAGITALYKKLNDDAAYVIGFKENHDSFRADPATYMSMFNRVQEIQTKGFDEALTELKVKMKPYLDFHSI